jgi:hypothetical protein
MDNEEPVSYHRRGHWFEPGTAHHTEKLDMGKNGGALKRPFLFCGGGVAEIQVIPKRLSAIAGAGKGIFSSVC